VKENACGETGSAPLCGVRVNGLLLEVKESDICVGFFYPWGYHGVCCSQ